MYARMKRVSDLSLSIPHIVIGTHVDGVFNLPWTRGRTGNAWEGTDRLGT